MVTLAPSSGTRDKLVQKMQCRHKQTDKYCIFVEFVIFFLRDALPDFAEILQSENTDDLLC